MTDNKSGEILIIEDDKDINDLLATALSKAGYRTRQAWSGTEGELLLKLDREAYALVLLDLMLPGLSGEELLARIRQMDASLPVIILTAKDELDEKINLLVAGADDYITKPFEIKEVVARVAVQLRHAVADVPSKSGQAGENQTKAENETGQGDTANTYIAGPAIFDHRQFYRKPCYVIRKNTPVYVLRNKLSYPICPLVRSDGKHRQFAVKSLC